MGERTEHDTLISSRMFQTPDGGFGSIRDRTGFFARRSGPFATLLAFFLSLIVLIVLLVPIVAIALIVIAWMILSFLLRSVFRLFRSSTQPNGVLDGRRNVRVRMPSANDSN
jgi:hypothetical protein